MNPCRVQSEALCFRLNDTGQEKRPVALDYILVRNSDTECWRLAQFTHFEDNCAAVLGGNVFCQWKPYKNNRQLLGMTDPEWHRDFKFHEGDRVQLANCAATGTVAVVFKDESFEFHPYRVNWDNGSFGFYNDNELNPLYKEMTAAERMQMTSAEVEE